MTDRELEKAKAALRNSTRGKFIKDYTDEERRKYVELGCIEMINSILAYNPWEKGVTTAEEIMEQEEDGYYNYLAKYVDGQREYGLPGLGRDAVIDLIQGQMDDIEGIDRDVHTDSEGVSYNSIRFREKPVESMRTRKNRKVGALNLEAINAYRRGKRISESRKKK